MTEKELALKKLMAALAGQTGETEPDIPIPVLPPVPLGGIPAPKTPNVVVGAPPDQIPVPQYQQLIPEVPAETLPPVPVPVAVEPPAPTPEPVSTLPAPIAGRSRTSADVQNDISAIGQKDYSITKDANGNEIRGKDRSRNWTTAQKILSSLAGAGMGLLQGGIGGALVGGILGGTNRNYFAQQRDNRNLARYIPEQQRLQKQEEFQSQQALRNAQTATIPIDDALKRDQLAQRKIEIQQKAQDKARETIFKAGWFDPTDPVHIAQAKTAGLDIETLKGWDSRNPRIQKVAGISYKLDPRTGEFVQSELPTDESEALTTYDVTMPNGEVRTFKVANKDAARFASQAEALRMNISARADEGEKTRAFQIERDKLGQQLKIQFEEIQRINKEIAAESDMTRKQALEAQKLEADKELIRLRAELAKD